MGKKRNKKAKTNYWVDKAEEFAEEELREAEEAYTEFSKMSSNIRSLLKKYGGYMMPIQRHFGEVFATELDEY